MTLQKKLHIYSIFPEIPKDLQATKHYQRFLQFKMYNSSQYPRKPEIIQNSMCPLQCGRQLCSKICPGACSGEGPLSVAVTPRYSASLLTAYWERESRITWSFPLLPSGGDTHPFPPCIIQADVIIRYLSPKCKWDRKLRTAICLPYMLSLYMDGFLAPAENFD